jgi:heat shock protein HslJ
MKKIYAVVSLVVLVVMLLSACTGQGGNQQGNDNRANLEGREWRLVEINGQPALESVEATATFANGEVAGSTSCNSYGGEYRVNGDLITIGTLVQTEMACMGEGIMEQEGAFTQAMMQAASFQATADRLEIRNGAGETTLVFTR